jgi:tungstate transport system substrate-binding protein
MLVRRFIVAVVAAICAVVVAMAPLKAEEMPTIRLAVTTSFENSGLAEFLLPQFTEVSGIDVHLIVVGTGQALKLGRQGDVDVLLVHAKAAEIEFVEAGFAVDRRDVMYNDFVIAGPNDDPAQIRGVEDVTQALRSIARAEAAFLSRGDDSGTHRKELSLWTSAGIDAANLSVSWYRSTGAGMGATLNTAAGLDAYVLVDRGTWLSFANKQNLELLMFGDPPMFNQYGVLVINPDLHEHVQYEMAVQFRDWITSDDGQQIIGAYRLMGERLFNPNYEPNS